MKLTVEYKTQIRSAAGLSSEIVECDAPCTIQTLIDRVVEKHDDSLRKMLLDSDGNLQQAILLFLGDRHVRLDASFELSDGDVLTIFSPISGG